MKYTWLDFIWGANLQFGGLEPPQAHGWLRPCLFTTPDTLAVGRIVFCHKFRRTTHGEKPNRQNFRVWNTHGERSHVTMRIPVAEFSAVRFYSYTVRHIRSTIGVFSDSSSSCLRWNQ